MLKKIKQLLYNKEYKVLISNFLSLSILQGLNIILPFLTFPFLIKQAGLESFGIISYANNFVLFFIVFIEYGFNTISTRDISIHSDDKKKVAEIYSEVLTTKLLLLLVAFCVFSTITLSIPKFREHLNIYLLSFLSAIGYVIFPVWLFQGLQKMKYITYINVFFKSIFTICIFIFLKDESNIWVVPLCTSLGFITSGIASLVVVNKLFNLNFRLSSFKSVKYQLKNAYHIFTSEMYVSLIAYANTLILGFFAGNTVVGIYSAAEKIIRACGSLISTIINSLYPHVSKTIHENLDKGILFVKQIEKWGKWAILCLIISLFFLADYIFHLIYGHKNIDNIQESVLIFRIMIFFPLFSFLDQIYGKLVLIVTRREKLFFKVFATCSIINLFLCTLLSWQFGYIGTAISSTLTQFFVVVGMYYYAKPLLTANKNTVTV